MWSNCGARAWHKFVIGEAAWVALRHTEYSRLSKYTARWWWKWTLSPIGAIGLLLCWYGLGFFWKLRWGRWAHAAWVLPDGSWWEFQPDEDKTDQIFPPLAYIGKDQKIERYNVQNLDTR